MRLLPLDKFAPVFEPLQGQRVGVVDGPGNVGDVLLQRATRQLLNEFEVDHVTVNPLAETPGKLDRLLLFAGGNLGYPPAAAIRAAAVATSIPCTVLPQSVILFEEPGCDRLFVRDQVSLSLAPRAEFAPDLALGFKFPEPPMKLRKEHGLFLRRHGHALFSGQAPDPVEICHTPQQYWQLASRYKSITTDRLHFAITAMGVGCDVTLLPVAYHKNRSVWETSLEAIGCQWADGPG